MNCYQPAFTHLSPQPIRASDSHLPHRPNLHTDRRAMHTSNSTSWNYMVRSMEGLFNLRLFGVEWKDYQRIIKGKGCGMKFPCLSNRYYPIRCTTIVTTHTHMYTKISFIHTVNFYVFRSVMWPSTGILSTKVKYIKGTK